MKKTALLMVVILIALTLTCCGSNEGTNSGKYASMLTSHTWYNSWIGTITYSADGSWTTKSLYAGRTGHWKINGDTLNEGNKDGEEWSYSYIKGITDEDIENAMDDETMMQETWKGQWYVSDHYLMLGKIVYKATE